MMAHTMPDSTRHAQQSRHPVVDGCTVGCVCSGHSRETLTVDSKASLLFSLYVLCFISMDFRFSMAAFDVHCQLPALSFPLCNTH